MNRSNFNIYDEFRQMNKDIKDSVLEDFLKPRRVPYQNKFPEYLEEPKEVYISSSGLKTDWIWDQTVKMVNAHYQGNNVNFMFFDYLLAMKHGLKTRKQLESAKRNKGDLFWAMEMENRFWGESEDAFFKFKTLNRARTILEPFYPKRKFDKKSITELKKEPNEIRFISVDIALRKGKWNDNTIISCFRLFPTKENGYEREVVYMEAFNGTNSLIQATRFKQLFYEFQSDYFVIDVQNAGTSLYDYLTATTYDAERGIKYDPWTVIEHSTIKSYDDFKERTLEKGKAVPVIYPIAATADLNHFMAQELQEKFASGMLKILSDETKAEDYIAGVIKSQNKQAEDILSDDSYMSYLMHPFEQITAFINETVSLEVTLNSGKIKLKEEKRTNRKDRYSSIAYGNHFACIKDTEIMKDDNEDDWDNYLGLYGKKEFSTS